MGFNSGFKGLTEKDVHFEHPVGIGLHMCCTAILTTLPGVCGLATPKIRLPTLE